MKKIMTLVIGVSLLFPSGTMFAQVREGVQLEITKTDGKVIKGELIGVKQDSTLILESSPIIGASIDVSEVKIIKIVKGSNAGAGFLGGLLAGGAVGASIGSRNSGHWVSSETLLAIGALIGGFAGGLVGGMIGSSTNKYETFQIEGKSQEQIKAVIEKLRTQAHFHKYQ
jgi:outer membrane lipoprotein SlyB